MKFTSHKRVGFGLSLATVIAVMTSLLSFAPAEAGLLPPPAPRIEVNVSDAYVKAQCRFSVSSVNGANGNLSGPLSLKVAPARLSVLSHIAQVTVVCVLDHGIGPAFEKSLVYQGGPYGRKSERVSFSGNVQSLCILVSYTLRDGTVGSRSGCRGV